MQSIGLDFLDILSSNQISDERESGVTHTPYETEVIFLTAIKSGNVENVRALMKELLQSRIVIGKLSDNNLRQIQYWAVCCITLATRYAIQGGLDETEAFNYSDECIMKVDKMNSAVEIFKYLQQECLILTSLVADNSHKADYPYPIRKCMHYINTNLHEKITLDLLSSETFLSPDYLAQQFKKYVGITISEYIRKKRLSTAKDMLEVKDKYTTSQITYYLGFCSESYFIHCFKKEYGVTPKQYKRLLVRK